jgi:hypothetical protein
MPTFDDLLAYILKRNPRPCKIAHFGIKSPFFGIVVMFHHAFK